MSGIHNLSSLILALICGMPAMAQYNFEAVFPGQQGDDLATEVRNAYRPINVLDYGEARDSMFRNVYGLNDAISCVYTAYTLPMPPGQDPTDAVFMNGAPDGINTEHTWPRSYGAEFGHPKSDMHHLYPTRVDVNAHRGNLPFAEVPDAQTLEWYYLGIQQDNVPGADIHEYSERGPEAFEPREAHKGNVARAMMYFKTIYPQEALQAPQGYWENMIPTLCDWHGQDPVDSLEWHRTWTIAGYQNDRPNPFVLDCTLAERLFCPGFSGACDPTVPTMEVVDFAPLRVFPNPTQNHLQIDLDQFPRGTALQIHIFNSWGQLVYSRTIETHSQANLTIDHLPAGAYYLQWQMGASFGSVRFIKQ